MILAKTEELARYEGLNPNFPKAFAFLSRPDLAGLPDGKHEIDGEKAWAVLSSYNSREYAEGKYETHREYVDVQFLISGEELIYWNDAAEMSSTGYAADCDKENYADPASPVCIRMEPGNALVLFSRDAHKANCRVSAVSPVRKVLLKIKNA